MTLLKGSYYIRKSIEMTYVIHKFHRLTSFTGRQHVLSQYYSEDVFELLNCLHQCSSCKILLTEALKKLRNLSPRLSRGS